MARFAAATTLLLTCALIAGCGASPVATEPPSVLPVASFVSGPFIAARNLLPDPEPYPYPIGSAVPTSAACGRP